MVPRPALVGRRKLEGDLDGHFRRVFSTFKNDLRVDREKKYPISDADLTSLESAQKFDRLQSTLSHS